VNPQHIESKDSLWAKYQRLSAGDDVPAAQA
jgi:hypothetical protein